MKYGEIDAVIDQWARRHLMKVMRSWANDECRNVYVSDAFGNCAQIWIDPPGKGQIAVHAAAVESKIDDEWSDDWHVPVPQLNATLEEAFEAVQHWFNQMAKQASQS